MRRDERKGVGPVQIVIYERARALLVFLFGLTLSFEAGVNIHLLQGLLGLGLKFRLIRQVVDRPAQMVLGRTVIVSLDKGKAQVEGGFPTWPKRPRLMPNSYRAA